MTTTPQPRVLGRKLPPNDWEGDDTTPGAAGRYVTCQDTAAGRMLYYATNGKYNLDGKTIRAAVKPLDYNGISLSQAAQAIRSLTSPDRTLHHTTLELAQVRKHLAGPQYGGIVVDGLYYRIPRAYRYQDGADFAHAIFISHFTKSSGYRVWDPLNRNPGYGRWYPPSAIEPFIVSLDGLVGWIELEPLK